MLFHVSTFFANFSGGLKPPPAPPSHPPGNFGAAGEDKKINYFSDKKKGLFGKEKLNRAAIKKKNCYCYRKVGGK